jgi:TusA-related sulfurtransferase
MTVLDLTGVQCPMNWVHAKLQLERMQPGEILRVRLDPGEALDSVPRMAGEDGHAVSVDGELVTIVKSA